MTETEVQTAIEVAQAVATCGTKDCMNFGHPVNVPVDAKNPRVVCGPCGKDIKDVKLS